VHQIVVVVLVMKSGFFANTGSLGQVCKDAESVKVGKNTGHVTSRRSRGLYVIAAATSQLPMECVIGNTENVHLKWFRKDARQAR
jgi:hypothetical protein